MGGEITVNPNNPVVRSKSSLKPGEPQHKNDATTTSPQTTTRLKSSDDQTLSSAPFVRSDIFLSNSLNTVLLSQKTCFRIAVNQFLDDPRINTDFA